MINDFLWYEIDSSRRDEYKEMITRFASLTELFAQKKDGKSDKNISTSQKKKSQKPFISSKFQETVFKHAFDASIEDIGNTSYDASLDPDVVKKSKTNGSENFSSKKASNKRYLFGIKTFLIDDQNSESFQKIAQFKSIAESLESTNDGRSWVEIVSDIRKNAKGCANIGEINKKNKILYEALAKKIAEARNDRIETSKALIEKRLQIGAGKAEFKAVYHFLMPSVQSGDDGEKKIICLGEVPYERIGETIEVLGATDVKHPTNFTFKDEYENEYKYTSADSQLYMKFKHKPVNDEAWPVNFVEKPYECFKSFFEQMVQEAENENVFESAVQENHSFSFMIQIEKYSGFNNFYGLSSKLGSIARDNALDFIKKYATDNRDRNIKKLVKQLEKYLNMENKVSSQKRDDLVKKMREMIDRGSDDKLLKNLADELNDYLGTETTYSIVERKKLKARDQLTKNVSKLENDSPSKYKGVAQKATSLLWRTPYEMYIRLPISFHREFPDFFGKDLFEFDDKGKLKFIGKRKEFEMSFGPLEKDKIKMHLTQSSGKGLQSSGTQTHLGKWILKDVFQLKEWEPLTERKLKKTHINGFRLKKDSKGLIHFEFIWIDAGNPPIDFWGGRD